MKIRQDFVTNSSSTNFTISINGEFTVENFFKGLGITEKFCVPSIFEDLFNLIDDVKRDIEVPGKYDTFEDFLDRQNDQDREYVESLLAQKRKVYTGAFEDTGCGGSYLSEFFCYTSIYVKNDDLFFDASDDRF